MTALLALLAVGAVGSAGSALGLAREGRSARSGAALGLLALLVIAGLAFALQPPLDPGSTKLDGTGVLADRLAPSSYLRLAVALWALDAILIALAAWLIDGLAGLRGLLPATLAAITGGTIALAATDATLGAAAAGATGLAVTAILLVTARPGAVEAAVSELRVSLIGPVLLIGAAAMAPVAAALVLRGLSAPNGGSGTPAAVVGVLSLAVAATVAVRFGVIPFHIRVPRLSDASPPFALPLALAWIPVPLALVALGIADHQLAPLALPLQGERAIVVGVALVTLIAAALAAFAQDDLRHATGYLVVADGALVLLGLGALDPAAWGPARTWLMVLAASKSGLLAWAAVVEARFETRGIPDLRGWLRRAPILGAALLVITLATFGLPGWVAFDARASLATLATGSPWDALIIVTSFATLPTYLRLLMVGTGPPTSKVSRAAPERIVRGWRPDALPIEHEHGGVPAATDASATEATAEATAGAHDPDPATTGDEASATRRARRRRTAAPGGAVAIRTAGERLAGAGHRLTRALRRDQAELVAAAVLALAILAVLTSYGALDVSGAAAQPAPIVSSASSD